MLIRVVSCIILILRAPKITGFGAVICQLTFSDGLVDAFWWSRLNNICSFLVAEVCLICCWEAWAVLEVFKEGRPNQRASYHESSIMDSSKGALWHLWVHWKYSGLCSGFLAYRRLALWLISMTASTIYFHGEVAFLPALLGARPFWRKQVVIVIMRPPNIAVCVIGTERVWYFARKKWLDQTVSIFGAKCMELRGGSVVQESETWEVVLMA